jgi:hypothetical protein
MDIQQMMEHLLPGHEQMMADRKENQAKADTDRKAWQEEMATSHKDIVAETETETEKDEEKMACQGTMEARLEEKEPTSLDRKPKVAQ